MRSPWPDWAPLTTLRGRLTLWNTGVVLAMTLASLVAARYVARATLYADADAELRAGGEEVVLALRDLHPDLDAVIAEVGRKARSHEQRGWFSQLVTEDGTTVWKSDNCPQAVADYPPSRLDREENIVQVGPYRYVRLRIARPGQPSYHVRVGTYTTGLDARLTSLLRQLTAVGLALSLLTPLAGWWLARQATKPVADMLRVADHLRPTKLGDRLPVRGNRDEIDCLAGTINRLLDQVAGHVDRQQQFVADAAHELRGPLAAMRSTVEVAITHDRSSAEYRDTLTDVLDEMRHLSSLANGLLTLAETGADADVAPGDDLDLAHVVQQAAAMFCGVAEERGIGIGVHAAAVRLRGSVPQLRQVLGNLLDNAIRFTPRGGDVRLRLEADAAAGRAVLTVADTGTGISAAHIDHVFDRFYKADPARSRTEGRSGGLGLPICKAIIERHGGTIAVASVAGQGTTVTVSLPLTETSLPRRLAAGPAPLAVGAS
jgi:two-component system heavy metal sensor histidine kinase CusS